MLVLYTYRGGVQHYKRRSYLQLPRRSLGFTKILWQLSVLIQPCSFAPRLVFVLDLHLSQIAQAQTGSNGMVIMVIARESNVIDDICVCALCTLRLLTISGLRDTYGTLIRAFTRACTCNEPGAVLGREITRPTWDIGYNTDYIKTTFLPSRCKTKMVVLATPPLLCSMNLFPRCSV